MRKIIYILASVCLLSGTAHAQEAMQIPANTSPEQIKAMFEEATKAEFDKIDTNKDLKLSKSEFLDYQLEETKAKSSNNFDKLDRNLDEFLSEEEIFEAMISTMQNIKEQAQLLQDAQEDTEQIESVNEPQEQIDVDILEQVETSAEHTSEPDTYSEPEAEPIKVEE